MRNSQDPNTTIDLLTSLIYISIVETPSGPDTITDRMLTREEFTALHPLNTREVDYLHPGEKVTYVSGDVGDPDKQTGYSAAFAERTDLLDYPQFEIGVMIYRGSNPNTRPKDEGEIVTVSTAEIKGGRVREPVSRYK